MAGSERVPGGLWRQSCPLTAEKAGAEWSGVYHPEPGLQSAGPAGAEAPLSPALGLGAGGSSRNSGGRVYRLKSWWRRSQPHLSRRNTGSGAGSSGLRLDQSEDLRTGLCPAAQLV